MKYIFFLLISTISLMIFAKQNNIEIKDLGIKFIHIPSGEFSMGQTDREKKWLIRTIGEKNYKRFSADERPLHRVFLDEYWIAETEITIKQFTVFVSDTGYITDAEQKGNAFAWTGGKWGKKKGASWIDPGFVQEENHPVVCVTWNDSIAFCKWLSKKTGFDVSLPTEAQWERAASGDGNTIYPWGNGKPNKKRVNFADKACYKKYNLSWADRSVNDGFSSTSPVGNYKNGNSIFGIKDMAGNVWEWCQDTYSKDYYSNSPKNNPKGPQKKGSYRVIRGGGWGGSVRDLRNSFRFKFTANFRVVFVGFRPVIIKMRSK